MTYPVRNVAFVPAGDTEPIPVPATSITLAGLYDDTPLDFGGVVEIRLRVEPRAYRLIFGRRHPRIRQMHTDYARRVRRRKGR